MVTAGSVAKATSAPSNSARNGSRPSSARCLQSGHIQHIRAFEISDRLPVQSRCVRDRASLRGQCPRPELVYKCPLEQDTRNTSRFPAKLQQPDLVNPDWPRLAFYYFALSSQFVQPFSVLLQVPNTSAESVWNHHKSPAKCHSNAHPSQFRNRSRLDFLPIRVACIGRRTEPGCHPIAFVRIQ